MINFFTNRELSQALNVNLAKWKRWSREFLPPDPLGGMQSGYARQYNLQEAFTVHLGGHLVSHLKLSIPEARQVLNDLTDWIECNLFHVNEKKEKAAPHGAAAWVKRYTIFIIRKNNFQYKNHDFFYIIRGTVSDEPLQYHGYQIRQELYLETSIPPQEIKSDTLDMNTVRLLDITSIYTSFLTLLNQPKS